MGTSLPSSRKVSFSSSPTAHSRSCDIATYKAQKLEPKKRVRLSTISNDHEAFFHCESNRVCVEGGRLCMMGFAKALSHFC